MNENRIKTRKRVNVTLPPGTLRMIDRVTEKGDRSRLIEEAVRFYVKEMGRANLRQQLRAGAIARAERDLRVAEEWFPFENETWRGNKK